MSSSYVNSQPDRPLVGSRVLVVDDEADARELIAFLLEQGGAEIRTAMSAREALHWLENESFDVLVSDIAMPGQDGYALIEAVRTASDSRHRHIAAVAVSGRTAQSDRDRAIEAGFNWYLGKPIDPDRLAAIVVTALHDAGGPTNRLPPTS